MRNVLRMTTEGKIRPVRQRALHAIPAVEDQASVIALIQAVIPWGLQAVGDVLEAEVTHLAGERYSRTGGQPGLVRWGQQAGSVYLQDQKLPIVYPRVRDLVRKHEVPLTTYEQLKVPRAADAGLFRKVLHGLSCRRYEACAEAVPEAFGLSVSSVSRRFIRASAQALEQCSTRRLEQDDIVGLVLDGKTFAEDSMVLALGILRTGEKKLLGGVQTATENEATCAALLELRRELQLINRSAATSLEDGLEETLTLHRLGVFGVLGRSLKTTNCLESLNACQGRRWLSTNHRSEMSTFHR